MFSRSTFPKNLACQVRLGKLILTFSVPLFYINIIINLYIYSSGFATTHVVVFFGFEYPKVHGERKIIKVVTRAARYGGGLSGFPDITRYSAAL